MLRSLGMYALCIHDFHSDGSPDLPLLSSSTKLGFIFSKGTMRLKLNNQVPVWLKSYTFIKLQELTETNVIMGQVISFIPTEGEYTYILQWPWVIYKTSSWPFNYRQRANTPRVSGIKCQSQWERHLGRLQIQCEAPSGSLLPPQFVLYKKRSFSLCCWLWSIWPGLQRNQISRSLLLNSQTDHTLTSAGESWLFISLTRPQWSSRMPLHDGASLWPKF